MFTALKQPLIVGTILFCTVQAYAATVVLDKLSASVNSSIIYHSDVRKFRSVLPLREQLDPLFANTPISKEKDSVKDESIVNYLIN